MLLWSENVCFILRFIVLGKTIKGFYLRWFLSTWGQLALSKTHCIVSGIIEWGEGDFNKMAQRVFLHYRMLFYELSAFWIIFSRCWKLIGLLIQSNAPLSRHSSLISVVMSADTIMTWTSGLQAFIILTNSSPVSLGIWISSRTTSGLSYKF